MIDSQSAAQIDQLSRALKAASGDVVVVASVPTFEPYGDINEYAVKLFENHGRGIGDKGKNNGLLIVLSLKERKVKVEVGYDLEQWVTDGFAGETIRLVMAPQFRNGAYGAGLLAGVTRLVGRIAEGRGVKLEGVPTEREAPDGGASLWHFLPILIFIAILIVSRIGGGRGGGGLLLWGLGSSWSGWSSGVGSFGGGRGGGFGGGGGGFGGGFGGFGGGSSGGGGASGSW